MVCHGVYFSLSTLIVFPVLPFLLIDIFPVENARVSLTLSQCVCIV